MILTILKIIGIVLLVILALVLVIILNVLLMPVRYEIQGSYTDIADGKVIIKWLPFWLKVNMVLHDKDFTYVVKLFGGVVLTNTDAKISILGRKLFAEEDQKAEEETDRQSLMIHEEPKEQSKEQKEAEKNPNPEGKKQEQVDFSKVTKKKKTSWTDKIKNKWNTFTKNLKNIREKKDALLKVYRSKRFEKAKKDVIIYIRQLLRVLKPKQLHGKLHFGFDDPALTGRACGVLALFLPCYDGYFEWFPEFESKCLYGNIYAKGKFALFPICVILIKVVFNKNLIKVLKRVQTIIER